MTSIYLENGFTVFFYMISRCLRWFVAQVTVANSQPPKHLIFKISIFCRLRIVIDARMQWNNGPKSDWKIESQSRPAQMSMLRYRFQNFQSISNRTAII